MESIAELHPIAVHFPIVLLIMYALFEAAGVITKQEFLSKSAVVLLVLGVLGAWAAALTGNQAEQAAMKLVEQGVAVPAELIEEHEFYANLTIWYFAVLAFARLFVTIKKRLTIKIKILFAVLAAAGLFFVYEAAEHGGELVYEHGVGTELLKETTAE